MARKVIHLMPFDGIGGVELAAATAEGRSRNGIRLERMFVFETVHDRSGRGTTFDPRAFWRAAGRLAAAEPDLVILSLWRAVIVGALARLRGCRAPMVLFLHNARDAHRLDRWTTRLAARHAAAIWADSRTTLDTRLTIPDGKPVRVISYLTQRLEPVRAPEPAPTPDFAFWGRLADQKDPLRTLALFRRIHRQRPDARLVMMGPDGGLRRQLEAAIAEADLGDAIDLPGPASADEIAARAAKASFYLQTSRYEGMSLSVVEAMQLGLVPAVTPVGEISRYTQDGRDAIWIDPDPAQDDAATRAILALIDAPDVWRQMQQRALTRWTGNALYADDILAAAESVLAGEE